MKDHPVLQAMIEEMTQRLSAAMEPKSERPLDPALIQQLLQQAAAKLDLVTQEDYQRLLAIHQRSRQKMDQLAARVAQLEAQVGSASSGLS